MKMRTRATTVLIAVVLAGVHSISATEQQAQSRWPVNDVLPLTCAQAWVKSGKNYRHMLSIVVTLARVSLANRELTFPDTRDAGMKAGKGIAADCKADPHGLLFAIVDKHARHVAEAAAAGTK